MKRYFPNEIEPKWQKKWKEDKLFSPNLDEAEKPFYSLMMFPYPSAEGLHVGNMYPFTATDIFARFKRFQGYDVFEPIGLDGFGIHSENYALKINKHPLELSEITEKRFYEQLTMIGNAFDWQRTVETYKENYYKWTQWVFLQMYKKGLAYKSKAKVNWCPSCKTVLADEQVISGDCERCGTTVIKKDLEQWFFRITHYAQRLLDNLEWIDWSEKVKIAQKNWIGRSEGALLDFAVVGSDLKLSVFTTALDTVYGVTFVVISPENKLLADLVTDEQKEKVEEYVQAAGKKSDVERQESKDKTGVFTGAYVINPFTNEEVSVWVADYVLSGYGTGIVMGVPGHDGRDHEFAEKFKLPIKAVIKPVLDIKDKVKVASDGFWEYSGIKTQFAVKAELFDSGEFSGLTSKEAKEKMIAYIEGKGLGRREINYHLRDWLISRQRYWGPPIPIIYCDKCGTVPVPEEDLPVKLPYIENFRPTGTGASPLASDSDFVNVKCPACNGPAERETDVSDNFLDSAWYFFRYPSTEFTDQPFDKLRTRKWLPVDIYIGGPEHALLHLLYTRFVTMALNDCGFLKFEEPFKKFYAHGHILAEGAKMSKSKGNVINPDKYIREYGADTFRIYLMFMGPLSEGGDFRDASVGGIYRFLTRVWDLVQSIERKEVTKEEQKMLAKTVKKVEEDIEALRLNTAIASLMEFLNFLAKQKNASGETIKAFLIMLAPFAPHMTEELYQQLRTFEVGNEKWELEVGNPDSQDVKKSRNQDQKLPTSNIKNSNSWSIHQQSWPKFDEKYLEEEEVTITVQVNGKVRDQVLIQKDMASDREVIEKIAKERPKVKKYLDGRQILKSVYVPVKIINFVV